jgi:D-amino-acid dehydrogenase
MGPVMVTVEYQIDPARAEQFAAVMRESRANRLQKGALSWGLFHDTNKPGHYIEYFLDDRADHCGADRSPRPMRSCAQARYAFHVGAEPPRWRHAPNRWHEDIDASRGAGSGVIGTSIAYYAAKAGRSDRGRPTGPALETSYANAGEVSPGYSAPWAGPGIPVKAIKWMLMTHSPLVIWPLLDPAMWRFGARMLANCTERAYRLNKSRMVPIAEYSRDCLKALRADTGIEYDERTQGTLQLFRTQKQLDGIGRTSRSCARSTAFRSRSSPAPASAASSRLAHTQDKFVGAAPAGDETGDCFCSRTGWPRWRNRSGPVSLRHAHRSDLCRRGQGRRHSRSTAARWKRMPMSARSAATRQGCSRRSVQFPCPVKGYSITVPIADAAHAPESTIMDETHKVAVTRLGDRIRVGGTAELAGYSLKLREARRETLEHVVMDLFPQGGDL